MPRTHGGQRTTVALALPFHLCMARTQVSRLPQQDIYPPGRLAGPPCGAALLGRLAGPPCWVALPAHGGL